MLRSAAQRGEPYDLAILDMQKPEMSGIELATKIKSDPRVSSTKLIMLSSIGQRGEGEEARRAGMDAYLTKPFKQSQLYDAIATVMGTPAEGIPVPEKDRQLVTRHTLQEAKARFHARILVAEDNAVNQKVAVKMLERLGYRADVAANGLEVVEALSRIPYAAVLMDVQMPEMDGYEATAEIRRREARNTNGGASRRIPVIAMTANALQGDREKALEAGMDDHIAKPVKPEDLAKRLEYWIPDTAIEMLPDAQPEEIEAPNEGTPPDEEPPLDENAVAGLRDLGGGPELLMELVDIFLGDAPLRLVELREAAKTGDASTVERVAHTLKGSASSMGAIPLGNVAADLQDVGSSGDLSDIESLLDRLEFEWERTLLALEGLKASERGNEA